jgi:glycosyltransferase involved in cell wall biosynthesis
LKRLFLRVSGLAYSLITGLKYSNFIIGEFEFSAKRISKATSSLHFDLVLFEYWHAWKSTSVFSQRNIPCVLDTHNILWQAYAKHYNKLVPETIKKRYTSSYKKAEENAWNYFNGVIAINKNEYKYIRENISKKVKVFLIEMGIDLFSWDYIWTARKPISFVYYGAISAQYNKLSALICVREIMPLIWAKFPDSEFWIIGSNPDDEILALQEDKRIHVTGFVLNVQDALKNTNIFLCPWVGTYGFRSRIIEVMAGGIPVISSKEAVYGMELEEGKGLLFAESVLEFANKAIQMIEDDQLLKLHSHEARRQIELNYSFDNTYMKGMFEIQKSFIN